MNPTISAVINFLKTIAFKPGGKILAAVSGGADSVAMLHILCRVAATKQSEVDGPLSQISNPKFEIICAHINHQLRGKESDEDEAFTAGLCEQLNITFFSRRIDVKTYAAQNRLSIETAARNLRLDALERIARQFGCQYIATAHHKNDQAETILFRLLRGTAFAGLVGIRPIIERNGLLWIRPMLHIRRTEIKSYCRQNSISWRQDASNIETHIRRNWIRHHLIPYLQRHCENDLIEKLAALVDSTLILQQQTESTAAKILQDIQKTRDSYLFFQSSVDRVAATERSEVDGRPDAGNYFSFSAAAIQQAGPFVAGEILRRVLNYLGCGLRDMSLSHYQQFFQLLDKKSGVLELPGGCTIRKKNDMLTFETKTSAGGVYGLATRAESLEIPMEGTIQFTNWRIQTRIIQITPNDLDTFKKQQSGRVCSFAAHAESYRQWFDLKKIKSPLIARSRRDDDPFIPFGRKTPKKIPRFLTDSQVKPQLKETCFVIEDKGGILWLAPVRRSTRAVIESDTINVLEICINKI